MRAEELPILGIQNIIEDSVYSNWLQGALYIHEEGVGNRNMVMGSRVVRQPDFGRQEPNISNC